MLLKGCFSRAFHIEFCCYGGMLRTAVECARSAGAILMARRDSPGPVRVKESQASIITDADLASEHEILGRIRARFPDHGVIAEESGFLAGSGRFTWVVDPLDGTSNFAAGLPWFGVIVAVLEFGVPVVGAMYLPASDTLYECERGHGVFRNGTRVHVSPEADLAAVLCGYGIDPCDDPEAGAREAGVLQRLVSRVRNVRCTNSLVDLCYAIDGRLGACVNRSTRIWDIAASCLMFREAGGVLTDDAGRPLSFVPEPSICRRSYSIVAANPTLHAALLRVLTG